MIRLIAFDLDDTLYPEHTFVESGFRVVARSVHREFGVSPLRFFRLLMSILKKGGRGYVFDTALRKCHIYTKRRVRHLVSIYRTTLPRIHPFPGITSLLRRLRKQYYLVLITDGDRAVQRRKVKALGLEPYFDRILYTDDYGRSRWKPSPYPFRRALKGFKVNPAEAVYIGDDPWKDFSGAKETGMFTIRVLQGRFRRIAGKRQHVDHTTSSLKEAISFITARLP